MQFQLLSVYSNGSEHQRHFSQSISTISFVLPRTLAELPSRTSSVTPLHPTLSSRERHSSTRETHWGPLRVSSEHTFWLMDSLPMLTLCRRLSLRERMHDTIEINWSCSAIRVDNRECDLESRNILLLISPWKASRMMILVSDRTQFSQP